MYPPNFTCVRVYHALSVKKVLLAVVREKNANSASLQKLMCKHIVISPDDVQGYSLLYFLITQAQLTNLDFD